jgi:hypothetical protein
MEKNIWWDSDNFHKDNKLIKVFREKGTNYEIITIFSKNVDNISFLPSEDGQLYIPAAHSTKIVKEELEKILVEVLQKKK